MKKYLLLLLVFVCIDLYGQVTPRQISPLLQAFNYMNKDNMDYNPVKAFEIIKRFADQGNARAMNILAILYSDGTGTTVNQTEALRLFKLSAEKGYKEAYYNLGCLYRKGWSVEQDFIYAFQLYGKGVSINSSACMYDQGYMLYKGLGVSQNYPQAIGLFRRGIKGGSYGSMYMLGLCFRNGYGITQNIDSALYWLNSAATKGFRFAKEELQVPVPEIIAAPSARNEGSYQTFQRVEHTAKSQDISGQYSGFIIRYDFSGQHVIGHSELKLKLEASNNTITGSWTEGDSPAISLKAKMTDSGLVFNNTAYLAPDHYSVGRLENYLFKDAKLKLVRQKDTVYMAGNFQLWSAKRNEPDKPLYIYLVRNTSTIKPVLSFPENLKVKASPVSELTVYPNPFTNSFELSFSLNQQNSVEISIVDLAGRNVYRENPKQLAMGNYHFTIKPNLPLGAYLLTVSCNGQLKSTIIVKQ